MRENNHPLKIKFTSLLLFVLTLAAIAFITLVSPEEKILGEYVRIVYLHGALVWTSLALFIAAGILGLVALISGQQRLHCWSSASGRSGLFFWVAYLPVSMWAMQANWNGLFLSEPRFRVAMIFAIVGILLQLGLTLIDHAGLTSAANLLYVAVLIFTLQSTENVLHPPSVMLQSDLSLIQIYFGGLIILMITAAGQVTRWLYRFETRCIQ